VPKILLKLNDDDFERNISAAVFYKNDFVGILIVLFSIKEFLKKSSVMLRLRINSDCYYKITLFWETGCYTYQ